MPFNVAAGNSSGYNYASGRLDHQTYFKSLRVEQAHLGQVVLDRILSAWLAVPGGCRPDRVANSPEVWPILKDHNAAQIVGHTDDLRVTDATLDVAGMWPRKGDWDICGDGLSGMGRCRVPLVPGRPSLPDLLSNVAIMEAQEWVLRSVDFRTDATVSRPEWGRVFSRGAQVSTNRVPLPTIRATWCEFREAEQRIGESANPESRRAVFWIVEQMRNRSVNRRTKRSRRRRT